MDTNIIYDEVIKFFNYEIYNEYYRSRKWEKIHERIFELKEENAIDFNTFVGYRRRLISWRDHYRFKYSLLEKRILRIPLESESEIRKIATDICRSLEKCVIDKYDYDFCLLLIKEMIYVRAVIVSHYKVKGE